MLDGPVSDVVEGMALSYALGKVDVVSCSWGPLDDGRRVEGPGRLAEMSLKRGVEEVRWFLLTILWDRGQNFNFIFYFLSILGCLKLPFA